MASSEVDNNLGLPAREYDTSSRTSSDTIPVTPASDMFVTTPTTDPDVDNMQNPSEIMRLRKELEATRTKLARVDQELHATRLTTSTFNQALGTPSEADFPHYKGDVTEHTISKLQNAFNAATRPVARQEAWPLQDDNHSEASEALSAGAFNRGQAIWGNGMRPALGINVPAGTQQQQYHAPTAMGNNWSNANGVRPYFNTNVNLGMTAQPYGVAPPQQRPSSGPRMDSFRGNQFLNEPTHFPLDRGARGGMNPPSRPSSAFDVRYGNQFAHYPTPSVATTGNLSPTTLGQMGGPPMGPPGMYPPVNIAYQPQPIGSMTRLSPEAAEFSVDAMAPTPWNAQVNVAHNLARALTDLSLDQPMSNAGSHYVSPQEPMNYRRLLDRNMNCDWKIIVDKIVGNNDQQASIFLQQKLKVGTAEQKFEIVEAIIAQAYPLMVNRFGNFLVQRCFEHGTPEQVIAIANAIRGNTLTLSMDAFGCHVIQKAFDAVPEEYKAIMVHELLRRIPETVIHRYACHVWQKLFELRWSDSPPQIMKYVNEALRGMWHEVALGETGSLVVQNIFENCLEEDKVSLS
jgi:hypothetical protein